MKSELVISKSELVISKSELTISKMSFEHFPNYCDERLVRIQFCFCLLNGDEAGRKILMRWLRVFVACRVSSVARSVLFLVGWLLLVLMLPVV